MKTQNRQSGARQGTALVLVALIGFLVGATYVVAAPIPVRPAILPAGPCQNLPGTPWGTCFAEAMTAGAWTQLFGGMPRSVTIPGYSSPLSRVEPMPIVRPQTNIYLPVSHRLIDQRHRAGFRYAPSVRPALSYRHGWTTTLPTTPSPFGPQTRMIHYAHSHAVRAPQPG
jgi:hypothetical protein